MRFGGKDVNSGLLRCNYVIVDFNGGDWHPIRITSSCAKEEVIWSSISCYQMRRRSTVIRTIVPRLL